MAGLNNFGPYDPTDMSQFLAGLGSGAAGMGYAPSLSSLGSGSGGTPSWMPAASPVAMDNTRQLGAGGWLGIDGLGANMDSLKLGLGGLQSLGNLYASLSSLGLAKDQFKYTKGVTDTNLNNSIKSYNTSLEDRATSRAVQNGTSSSDLAAYLDKNRLSR